MHLILRPATGFDSASLAIGVVGSFLFILLLFPPFGSAPSALLHPSFPPCSRGRCRALPFLPHSTGSRGGGNNPRGGRHSRTSGCERRPMVIWNKPSVEESTVDGPSRPVRPHSYHTRAQWETSLQCTPSWDRGRCGQPRTIVILPSCKVYGSTYYCRSPRLGHLQGPVPTREVWGRSCGGQAWTVALPRNTRRTIRKSDAIPTAAQRMHSLPSSTISTRDNGTWG